MYGLHSCAILLLTSGTGHNLGPLVTCFTPVPLPSPPMEQLYAALIGLGVVVIGAIGTLVTVLIERVKRDVAANTKITEEARAAANGNLRNTIERLASERNKVLGLREIVREREDRLAYIKARHPEVEETERQYRDRRTSRATEADELAAERRILAEDIDDPTGTDAGAHPG